MSATITYVLDARHLTWEAKIAHIWATVMSPYVFLIATPFCYFTTFALRFTFTFHSNICRRDSLHDGYMNNALRQVSKSARPCRWLFKMLGSYELNVLCPLKVLQFNSSSMPFENADMIIKDGRIRTLGFVLSLNIRFPLPEVSKKEPKIWFSRVSIPRPLVC